MNNIRRIQEALVRQGLDAILLTDEKNQRYAAGFPFTDGAVLIGREKAWLLTDSRYIEAAEKTAGGCCTVQMFDREKSLSDLMRAALKECGAEKLAAEDESLCRARWNEIEKTLGLPLLPAGNLMMSLRAEKSEEEIACMIRAQRISEKALEEVLPLIRPGMTEKEVMAELVYHMLKNGSEGNSFDPIVVAGTKTSMPHGVPGDNVIREGDFVTMDFGSLAGGYCSDMTRTVAVGHATEEMRTIYGIVLEAQLAGIAAARSGVPGKLIDRAARDVIEKAGYGLYFGHGFGHSLGLDIHEPPMAGPRGEAPMAVNDVCSAEPGIYLPGKFGVRIEDVMIIREDGAEVITRAPKSELIVLKN
jgi:Xaa-Pro aminopeptidase